jgi:hypothetical protein
MDGAALPAPGLPIRKSAGQRLFSASPRLIAAVHVLPRLLVPRHPPHALNILTVSSAAPEGAAANTFGRCAVFKLRRDGPRRTSARSPSKLSSHTPGRHSGLLPRKEVIQPQLPLRLPCYDFTPITSPTFDGCLPKGLAHRLRVLPAFVV